MQSSGFFTNILIFGILRSYLSEVTMGIPALICALALLFAAPARAAEETWVKVQAPHFLVLSNGSLKDAREVATDFEQIHAVFAQAFPKLRTDSSADTIVLAV